MQALMLVFLLVGVSWPAFAGGPPSLTGFWEGRVSCKTETANGKGKLEVDPASLEIAQLGPDGPLVVNFVAKGSGAYSGTIVPSVVKPGEGAGALIACGTSDATTDSAYNEIITFHYKVGADGSGSIKSTGVFVINSVQTAVCKGSWIRTGLFVMTVPCP